jgi:prepilin-type N-terminal cleavage/methylation domain-containing protein
MIKDKNIKGFTLIELLIVIGIISILAGITLVGVNPARQFGKANDAERKSEIGSILSAIYQYQTSPAVRGALPKCLLGASPVDTAIPECDTDNSGKAAGNGAFEGAIELGTPANAYTYDCSNTLIPFYLREIPIDPGDGYDETKTGYYICRNTKETVPRVYVIAVGGEVYTDDGGCQIPTTLSPAMCVSG